MPEPLDDGGHADRADDTERLEGEPFTAWERAASGVLGIVLAGAGSIAVFLTANQAGSVALVLVGAIFLVMSVSGTPILHARHGNSEIRMAPRRRRALRQVVDAPPSEAQRTLAALAAVDPASRRDPEFRRISAEVYERRIIEVFAGLYPDVDGVELRTGGDFVWHFPEGDIVAEARISRGDGAMALAEMREMVRRAATIADPGALLVVTNRPLPQLSDPSRRIRQLSSELGRRIALVRWTDEQDDAAIMAAVERLRRGLNMQEDRSHG